MLIAYLPALVALVGLLMFVLSSNPKVAKIGDIMLWTGLLVTLFTVAGKAIHIP